MNKNIGIGIIGYGKMGQIRHQTILDNDLGNVIAISEPELDTPLTNIPPNVSIEEIMNNKEIEVVIICTPNFLNKPLTIMALEKGKHVFCEKPPAFTSNDIKEIIEIEQKHPALKLMYGFNHRHHDSIMKMKRIIDEKIYGNILWMRGRYGKSVDQNFYNNWRANPELSGGGILIDQGIHMLDLFLHFANNFDSIKAEVSNLYWNMPIEDNVFAIFKNNKTGVVASLHSTMTQWRHLFSLEVFLEKGYMVLNGLITSSMTYGEEILSIAKNRTTAPVATWQDEEREKFTVNNSWRYEMEHFFNAIDNDSQIHIGNSQDAFKLMKIIDNIYKNKEKS